MPKKEERKRADNKYTRREFLKAGARVGAGAAIYGTIGYGLGKGYEYIKELIPKWGNKLVDYDDKVEALPNTDPRKVAKKAEDWRMNLFKRLTGRTDKDQAKVRESLGIKHPQNYSGGPTKEDEEDISKRSFLERLGYGYLNQAHKNPVPTLTITGAAYGAVKSTIKAIPKYLTNRKIARLKDQNASYEEKIRILEDYKSMMENSKERETEEVRTELERVGGLLENAGRASGKLETIVKEPPKENILLMAIGLTGLLASFVLNITKVSGFIIANNIYIDSIKLSLFLFLPSLILIFLSVRRKNIKIVQKNPYKFLKEEFKNKEILKRT